MSRNKDDMQKGLKRPFESLQNSLDELKSATQELLIVFPKSSPHKEIDLPDLSILLKRSKSNLKLNAQPTKQAKSELSSSPDKCKENNLSVTSIPSSPLKPR